MSPAPTPTPLPPAVLAQRYRLERRLAQGGMAEVWLGTDLSLTRQVAVKVLKSNLASDPVVAERFSDGLLAAAHGDLGARVVIQGDARLPVGDIRKTMLAVEAAGFHGVGLLAERAGASARGK